MRNRIVGDLVAQLVEHLPFKERVLGSSPSQVTIKRKIPVRIDRDFCFWNKAELALGFGQKQKSGIR